MSYYPNMKCILKYGKVVVISPPLIKDLSSINIMSKTHRWFTFQTSTKKKVLLYREITIFSKKSGASFHIIICWQLWHTHDTTSAFSIEWNLLWQWSSNYNWIISCFLGHLSGKVFTFWLECVPKTCIKIGLVESSCAIAFLSVMIIITYLV